MPAARLRNFRRKFSISVHSRFQTPKELAMKTAPNVRTELFQLKRDSRLNSPRRTRKEDDDLSRRIGKLELEAGRMQRTAALKNVFRRFGIFGQAKRARIAAIILELQGYESQLQAKPAGNVLFFDYASGKLDIDSTITREETVRRAKALRELVTRDIPARKLTRFLTLLNKIEKEMNERYKSEDFSTFDERNVEYEKAFRDRWKLHGEKVVRRLVNAAIDARKKKRRKGPLT